MIYVDADKLYPLPGLKPEQREARNKALNNLEAFIRFVAPYQLIASCHVGLCAWVQMKYEEHKMLLWPRDHGKSRYCAFYAAWEIVRDPATTIIYASATAEKAEEQLRFIKSILESRVVRKYFPGLINEEEGRRAAWNKTYIIVDHPERLREGVVDSTIMTCGLEKTITGKHCKRLLLDDIVVPENNTEQGRKDVNAWVAQAASITSADSTIFAVGTRYHPKDAYSIMMDMEYDEAGEDADGNSTSTAKSLFTINMANVEEDGEFLWPRHQRRDGRWFGFNPNILARKKAVYEAAGNITQFFAQYYNDPNDKSTAPVSRDLFKYYDRKDLSYLYGTWSIGASPLTVYAALDLAATVADASDFTVLTVGGLDPLLNRYVMEIERVKTDKMSKILELVVVAYTKYRFKKLRIEAVGGFRLVAQDLADSLYEKGVRIPIDLYIPPNNEAKAVRVNNILEPLYQTGTIYHYRGGNCQTLEDELCSVNPAHDDVKDAWAMCVDLMEPPLRKAVKRENVLKFHPKWGGVAA